MATKYEEMCLMYKNAQKEAHEYSERMIALLSELGLGFRKFIDVPDKQVTYQAMDGADQTTTCSMPHAIKWNPNDGWFHLGLRLSLAPDYGVLFDIAVAEDDGWPVAKLGIRPDIFSVATEEERSDLYIEMVARVNQSLYKAPNRLLKYPHGAPLG
jgi:hypothetical protein